MTGRKIIRGGKIVGPDEVYAADLLLEDGVITQIGGVIIPEGEEQTIDATHQYILPGFIDIHNHGAAGYDFSFGKFNPDTGGFERTETAIRQGLSAALEHYRSHGVTRVLLTTMAAPLEKLVFAFEVLDRYLSDHPVHRSLVYGINLEGTFLKDPTFAGAQNPAFFYEVDPDVVDRLQAAAGGRLQVVNLPPEHGEAAWSLTRRLSEQGMVIAGGHTGAYGDEFAAAVDAGLQLSVHFLNGPSRSSKKSFRRGGAEEMMLRSDGVYLEIICDGYHVDPSYVRDIIARKGYDRVIMITDSMFANGLSDLKKFELFGLAGAVSDNGEYLQMLGSENTLFGSVLNSSRGFANVVRWLCQSMPGVWHRRHEALSLDLALRRASQMFSANPARLLGIFEGTKSLPGTGSIEVGKSADLVLASEHDGQIAITPLP